MTPVPPIQLKRAYEAPDPADGRRILVERLWPRGVTRQAAALDAWVKDVAPSPELRKWYAHEPEKWPEFQRRYRAELEQNAAGLGTLREAMGSGPVTFVYAASDPERNSARLLRDYLQGRA
jgi:uncharacterized protein YeaO (DUF488 family)